MSATELYPLSTQDGKHIPLDVVRPLGLTTFTVTLNDATNIVIPALYNLVWVYSTVSCVLAMPGLLLPSALVSGTDYADSVFIPADTLMTLVVTPGDCMVLGLSGSGTLYMNSIEQWAALVQNRQANVG